MIILYLRMIYEFAPEIRIHLSYERILPIYSNTGGAVAFIFYSPRFIALCLKTPDSAEKQSIREPTLD